MGAVETIMMRLRLDGQRAVDAGLQQTARHVTGVGSASTRAGAASNTAFRGMGAGMSRIARGAAGLLAATGGVYALGRGFRFAWQEQDEARRVGGQTEAVIRSTGGAARVSAGHVSALAQRISDYAGIDDEIIQAGENILLTFRHVRNEVGEGNKIFDEATRLGVDMGVALGTDARSGAMMLGKALDNPIQGYSRLMRSGVSFSEAQIKRIRRLQEEGDLLGAQKIILREVAREFEGSARAQVQATDKLRVAIGNIAESAGGLFMPAVDEVVPYATRLARRIQRAIDNEDMTFGEKARFIWRATARDLDPAIDDVQRWLEREDVKRRVADGIETWTPRIIDVTAASMAKAGPRAAGAFIRGFTDMGPWGRLLTVAFLMSKMNAWGPAGRLAAGTFTGTFTRQLPGEIAARQGKFAAVGNLLGRAIGPAVAAYIGYEILRELQRRFGGALGDVLDAAGGTSPADSDPVVRRGRRMMDDPSFQQRVAAWEALHPDLARRMKEDPTWSRAMLRDLLRTRYPGLIPGATGVPRDYEGAFPPAVRSPPRARGSQSRPRPGRDQRSNVTPHRRRDVHIHNRLDLDGREVARNTLRHLDDDDSWGRD